MERTPARAQGAERVLAALIVDQPSRWEAISGQMSIEAVSDPSLRQVLATVCEMRAGGHADPTPAQVISRMALQGAEADGAAPTDELISGLVQLAQTITAKEAALRQSVQRILADAQRRRLAQLREQLRAAQQLGQDDNVNRLLVAYQAMVKGA